MKEIAEILKEKGLKVTPQRLAIYSMLKNTTSHPTAEKIYNTITNITCEYSNYDANTVNHQHIMCTCCKRVFDLDTIDDSAIKKAVADKTGFIVDDEQVVFYGICPECQKKNSN
jgi:Fur family peroxide stress response transcriptional regulator